MYFCRPSLRRLQGRQQGAIGGQITRYRSPASYFLKCNGEASEVCTQATTVESIVGGDKKAYGCEGHLERSDKVFLGQRNIPLLMLENSQPAAKFGAADGKDSPSHAKPNCHSHDSVFTVCRPAASVRSSHRTAVYPVSTGRSSQCPLGISSMSIVSCWRKEHRQRQTL